jgi:hypothetical protein
LLGSDDAEVAEIIAPWPTLDNADRQFLLAMSCTDDTEIFSQSA